jgi:hypothetical protein
LHTASPYTLTVKDPQRELVAPAVNGTINVLASCERARVNRVVLIQMSFYGYDNRYMLDAIKSHPGTFSGVAVIDQNALHPEMEMKELNNTGMVEIYNHQYMWDNRQYPKVHQASADIWGTEKLWVTIDRANLNFPLRPGFEYKGFIHWDYDPETRPQNVQGVLALADQTDENMGGFQCIPELYRTYDTWKLTQPEDRDHYKPDTSGFHLEKVKLEAGDLLIPRAEGAIGDDHVQGELGEVLLGRVDGRRSEAEITVFKSLGLAVEDVASAHHIHARAQAAGMGTWVELGGGRDAG